MNHPWRRGFKAKQIIADWEIPWKKKISIQQHDQLVSPDWFYDQHTEEQRSLAVECTPLLHCCNILNIPLWECIIGEWSTTMSILCEMCISGAISGLHPASQRVKLNLNNGELVWGVLLFNVTGISNGKPPVNHLKLLHLIDGSLTSLWNSRLDVCTYGFKEPLF